MAGRTGGGLWRLGASADPLEQLGRRRELQSSGEDHDRLESWGALAALQQTDLRAVQVAHVGECLLGEPNTRPVAAQICGELLADKLHD